MKSDLPNVWTASSLAAAAGVSKSFVAGLCRSGTIPARKAGNVWLIAYATGANWLNERQARQAR